MYRKALKKDAKNIGIVHYKSWSDAYKNMGDTFLSYHSEEELIEKASDKIETTIVYEQDAKIVGFLHYLIHNEYIYLDKLYILPNYQNKSIGQGLMRHFFDMFKEHTIKLDVIGNNQKAIHFYEKHGFKRTNNQIKRAISDTESFLQIEMIYNN